MKIVFALICCLFFALHNQAQYWQQQVKYVINVVVNNATNTFTGTQNIAYTNNSPDKLTKIFVHLYWNAFAPGSSMDERSRDLVKNILPNNRQDWDFRVQDRIANLQPNEVGKQTVKTFKLNGVLQAIKQYETILEVTLSKPIAPKQTVNFTTEFEAQVPIQIRRSGRDNAEGVRFSMAQWYPKICEYDKEGWHPTPYIAREFYGVWGNFDVTIDIDDKYCLAATGYLQAPIPKGFNYSGVQIDSKNGRHKWRFIAPNVHDFVWAADANYTHNTLKVRDGLTLHSFYKIDREKLADQFLNFGDRQKALYNNSVNNFIASYKTDWDTVLQLAAKALPYIEATFGKYAYNQYSFIQGGDGGMEYAMATLLKGAGRDVVIHEWLHSWYQGMLATNESLYSWMDEGFTTYAEDRTKNWLDGETAPYPQKDNFDSYLTLAKTKLDEPLTTHADQYNSNYCYSINSYSKGAVFIEQLGYIIGAKNRDAVLKNYYNQWRFKHPDAADFIKVAEKQSGIQLDWYRTFFVNTTKTIDYKIDSVWQNNNGGTNITLERVGKMPMPLDVQIKFKDGTTQIHYIPLNIMYGTKPNETPNATINYPACSWTQLKYTITTKQKLTNIVSIEIDPTYRMADIERKNNKIEFNW